MNNLLELLGEVLVNSSLLLMRLPSGNNAQHELQRWSLINTPRTKNTTLKRETQTKRNYMRKRLVPILSCLF